MKKYFIMFCLAGAIAFAPVSSASARSYHYGDRLIAAAVGGAVVGLVGAVVESALNPSRTVYVEHPRYVEPAPVVVRRTVVVREPYYYGPTHHIRHMRHHHRHH